MYWSGIWKNAAGSSGKVQCLWGFVTVRDAELRLTTQNLQDCRNVQWNRSCCTDLRYYWMQRDEYILLMSGYAAACMGDWAMRLPLVDVAASPGEQSRQPQHDHSVAGYTSEIGNRPHASLPPRHFSLKPASCCISYCVVTNPCGSVSSAATLKF